jgi:hypothetical protein
VAISLKNRSEIIFVGFNKGLEIERPDVLVRRTEQYEATAQLDVGVPFAGPQEVEQPAAAVPWS